MQLLETCPNARFIFKGTFSCRILDVLQAIAPRLHGKLQFNCLGLDELHVDRLKLCLSKLDSNYWIKLDVRAERAEQTAQSLLFDLIAQAKPSGLEKLSFHTDILSSVSFILLAVKSIL